MREKVEQLTFPNQIHTARKLSQCLVTHFRFEFFGRKKCKGKLRVSTSNLQNLSPLGNEAHLHKGIFPVPHSENACPQVCALCVSTKSSATEDRFCGKTAHREEIRNRWIFSLKIEEKNKPKSKGIEQHLL